MKTMRMKIKTIHGITKIVALALGLLLAQGLAQAPQSRASSDCGVNCGGGGTTITVTKIVNGKRKKIEMTLGQYLDMVKLEDGKSGYDKNELRKLIEPSLNELKAAIPENVQEWRRQFDALTWYKLDRPISELPYELTQYLPPKNDPRRDLWQPSAGKMVFMDPLFQKRQSDLRRDQVMHELVRGVFNDGRAVNPNLTEKSVLDVDALITRRPLLPADALKAGIVAAGFEVENVQALATNSSAIKDPVQIPVELVKPITISVARKAVVNCSADVKKEGALIRQLYPQVLPQVYYFEKRMCEFDNGSITDHCILPYDRLDPTAIYNLRSNPKLYADSVGYMVRYYNTKESDNQYYASFSEKNFEGSSGTFGHKVFDFRGSAYDLNNVGGRLHIEFSPVIELPQLQYKSDPSSAIFDNLGGLNENHLLQEITIIADRSTVSGSGLVKMKNSSSGVILKNERGEWITVNVPAYVNCLKTELENASLSQDADANSSSIPTALPVGVKALGDNDAAGAAGAENAADAIKVGQ